MLKRLIAPAIAAGFALSMLMPAPGADAAEKKDFKVCWSIYAGWMPWGHIQETGLVKKWAEKYGISVDIVQINDYVESINQYTAGAYDGCSMTNMDALSIPAGGGVDTTALIVGDYSNGNDGIVLKGKDKLADIKGQTVNLVELSVSHYLLARGLDSVGLSEKDVTVVTQDAVLSTFDRIFQALTLTEPEGYVRTFVDKGQPMANLLLRDSCTVTIAHSRTKDIEEVCRRADILVAAVGRAEMVRGDWLKPGAVVIDVGVNAVDDADDPRGYRLVGDVAFDEALDVAGAITPVPGGVGPMTIAMLMKNTVKAARLQAGLDRGEG